MLKKVATWAFIAFLVYYVVSDPHGAAGAAVGIMDWLRKAGNSLGQFLNGL